MTDKNPYAPPPNMQAPQGNKGPMPGSYPTPAGSYPTNAAYPPQPGFAPYGSSSSMPAQDPYMPNATTDTDPIVKGFEFSTESIRRGFIRKVYSILSIQLLVTLGAVMLFVYNDQTKEFADKNDWLFFVSIILVFVALITMCCCEGIRRTSPHNMIFLSLFTIGEAIGVAYSTMRFEADVVMMAVGLTAVVVIALTMFAFQTKWDFTMMGGTLFAALFVFFMVGIIISFTTFGRTRAGVLVMSSIGVLIFSAYLIYDTQKIMGGDHKYSMSPEEYIFGAITLYLDIINLFLYILRILGAATKN